MTDLVAIARGLLAGGKGFLAADEKPAHATTYLGEHSIAGGPEMRRKYRDLFFSTPGIERYLSGVILFEGSFEEKGSDKKLFPQSLAARGIAPGVTVDGGLEPFPDSPQETLTHGLIGLPDVLHEYKKKGAVFTKWRAAIHIEGDRLPSAQAILENAKRLATYARDAQMAGLVPVVEAEVLYPGKHSRARAAAVLEQTLSALFSVLEEQSVDRASVILKTSMALSGADSAKKDTPEEVAEDTLEVLLKTVPKQIAGIVFLSGGESPEQATNNLAAIVKRGRELATPWPLTFSFARALQEEALAVWQGKDENVAAAQAAFLARLEKVAEATYI